MSTSKGIGRWGVVVAVCLAFAGPAAAAEGDDDLALVKRAVASAERSERTVERQGVDESQGTGRSESRAAPAWLKVSIVEGGGDGASLSVNLPLALVKAIDEICDDEEAGDDGERRLGLSDLLAELLSGQPLVSIDSDDAEIRVWVE